MNTYNFNNTGQAEFYDVTRPQYTKEIFTYILESIIDKKDNYLDIACGTGQLTFPLSENFRNLKIGVDVSKEQITKANRKLTDEELNIYFYEADVFDIDSYIDTKKNGTSKIFDFISFGQALHWFEEEKIFPFLQKILKDDGTVGIIGYKKQHFLNSDPLYQVFEEYINLLRPYFECDIDNNDNDYYKFNFKKYFEKREVKHFNEESTISLNQFINFLKSWSGYYNYKKEKNEDPLIKFKAECKEILKSDDDDEIKINFYNFYFVIILHKLK